MHQPATHTRADSTSETAAVARSQTLTTACKRGITESALFTITYQEGIDFNTSSSVNNCPLEITKFFKAHFFIKDVSASKTSGCRFSASFSVVPVTDSIQHSIRLVTSTSKLVQWPGATRWFLRAS